MRIKSTCACVCGQQQQKKTGRQESKASAGGGGEADGQDSGTIPCTTRAAPVDPNEGDPTPLHHRRERETGNVRATRSTVTEQTNLMRKRSTVLCFRGGVHLSMRASMYIYMRSCAHAHLSRSQRLLLRPAPAPSPPHPPLSLGDGSPVACIGPVSRAVNRVKGGIGGG